MDISSREEPDYSPKWEELLGSNNWDNLLAPLNLSLRKLILRCGDFCQATYDAFNNDTNSKYCGSSRYGKNSFFSKVMLENDTHYDVVSFLYATARVSLLEAFILHSMSRESWDRESNWIGYIAITNDDVSRALGHREVYVAWRGTTRNYEWVNVLGAELESAESLLSPNTKHELGNDTSSSDSDNDNDKSHPKVMKGWLTIYVSAYPKSPFVKSSARVQLLTKLQEVREKYKEEKLSIVMTGHSLGASLSIVSAFDLVENGFSEIPVSAFVFGSPQIGNKALKQRMERYPNLKILHIRNKIDLIPHYPGRLLGYVDVGTRELVIDTRKSPSLKESKNPSDWHNLQASLHVVAGWNGEEDGFELKVKRSLALVNKSSACLKEECLVPESWWVEKNKGMVIDSGVWILAPPLDEDLPVPEL
ncbi:hypothetical protein CsatB_020450 [Cannabis sativa]